MPFYDLSKPEREKVVEQINQQLRADFEKKKSGRVLLYFSDGDTYIRKTAYLCTGRLYLNEPDLQLAILKQLKTLLTHDDFYVRQTVINAAGEIAKKDFEAVHPFFDTGLFDAHHAPRNAVIGSIKKAGEVNPKPVLQWAKGYLHHPDKEIRREICHGIELRGRKYPQDILPLLKELQYDTTARVRNTLVHVLGQIAYKKGCLKTVIAHLNHWENKQLVADALEEIIDVHHRYRNFAVLSQVEALKYIEEHST